VIGGRPLRDVIGGGLANVMRVAADAELTVA